MQMTKSLQVVEEMTTFTLAQMSFGLYKEKPGYDPEFLGVTVPMPQVQAALQDDIVPLLDNSGNELKYTHFSVVMSKECQLAYFTAVNIDGAHLQKTSRKSEVWYFDPRIDRKYQTGDDLYADNKLDLGHLVRRLDPVWGVQALQAQEDTYHFTNCAPQHQKLNRGAWRSLEDFILQNSAVEGRKVTVFTGPVFRHDDLLYRGKYRIPEEFWKVVVLIKTDGQLSVTAYQLTQRNELDTLPTFGAYKTYQVPLSQIEILARVSFGGLSSHILTAPGGTLFLHEIREPADIRL